jgi:hypothetical protein
MVATSGAEYDKDKDFNHDIQDNQWMPSITRCFQQGNNACSSLLSPSNGDKNKSFHLGHEVVIKSPSW